MLLLAYTLAYVDRAILTILVEPIQRDLRLDDTEIALLHGFAFVIFYVTLGVPLGFLADRTRRNRLAVASVLTWSVMTAACGLTRSFGQLFAARIGVGVGEAGLSPAAYSLIADSFPPHRRGAALGVYSLGVYVGGGLAILAGGAVVALVGARPAVTLPVLGAVRAWQLVFFIVSLPGLFVGALVATVTEPARRLRPSETGSDETGNGDARADLRALAGHLGRNARAYTLSIAGFAFLGVPFNVALLWARPYLSRHFGVSPAQGAYAVGGCMLVMATAGVICGGFLSDRLTARGVVTAPIRIGFAASVLVIAPVALLPLAPTLPLAIAALGALLFFGAFAYGAAAASLQLITPNRMRATVSALYLLIVNLVGLTAGPVVTGVLTDHAFHDKAAVGVSAAIVSAAGALIATACFAAVGGSFRRAAAAQSTLEGPPD